MKKFFWIILITLLFNPFKVKAYVNYDITDYLIDATILENGDLNVKELIVLDGTFNGYIRDIIYKNNRLSSNSNNFSDNDIYNAKGISNTKVYAIPIEEAVSFSTFNELFKPLTKVYFETDAQTGNYLESSITGGKSYKMYYAGKDESIAFMLTYTIKSAVVLHEDIAELYWTFIGENYDDEINNLQIKVHLPKEDNSKYSRVWAHGDITGTIFKTDDKTILATMKSLEKNHPVDLRITMDKSLITDPTYLNKTDKVALDEILEVEEQRALLTEQQIKKVQKITKIVTLVSGVFIIFLVIWWIYAYFHYDKEYKSSFKNKYNREFIDDYNVEVIDYLMKGTITPNAMTASILNLIYKKNIKVEEIKTSKKTKEYEFTLVNRDNINETEEVLLDFLFETVGQNNVFTTKQLQNYAKNNSSYLTFQSKYSNWLNCVRKDALQCNFYEKNGIPIVVAIFTLLISVLISFMVFYYSIRSVLGYLVFPLAFAYLFYSLMIKKRSKKGNEDFVRWQAFKNFLKDFGNFSQKELPQISLWERYLVYATIFGLAKEVEKAMKVKISEFNYQETSNFYPLWIDYGIANHLNQSINTSINNANLASARNVQSNSGGFGGNFSSGAGFGGGGGGGRGF